MHSADKLQLFCCVNHDFVVGDLPYCKQYVNIAHGFQQFRLWDLAIHMWIYRYIA